jgi:hypothetical protein
MDSNILAHTVHSLASNSWPGVARICTSILQFRERPRHGKILSHYSTCLDFDACSCSKQHAANR